MEGSRVKGVIPIVTSIVLLLALASLFLLPVPYAQQPLVLIGVLLAVGATWVLFTLSARAANGWYLITFWVALVSVATIVYAAGQNASSYAFLYMVAAVLLAIMPSIEMLLAGMASMAVVILSQGIISSVWVSINAYAVMIVTVWIVACVLGAGAWQLLHDVDASHRRLGRVKANNDALKEAEKDKTEILSLVSHQLKTPLALIRWSVESVLNNPHLKEKERDRLENAIGTTHVMYNTIEDLSHIFKLIMKGSKQYVRAEKISIDEILKEIASEFAAILEQRHIKLSVKKSHGAITAKADKVFLKHAIVNLLDNAIKYSPESGDISITAKAERDRVYIAVVDHGIGIEPANQDRIFERFYRTEKAREVNEHGTGLGLYLVRVIMEKMGGQVTLTSAVGKGSTFTLIAPRA